MPNYTVHLFVPAYGPHDNITGWAGRQVASAMTLRWAFRLARQWDSDGLDETYVEVRDHKTGRRVHSPVVAPSFDAFDNIPF